MTGILKINTGDFVPIQPGFEMNTSYYVEYKEKGKVDGSTILFYQFKVNEEFGHTMSVIPDGCIDILFCCNTDKPFANVCGSVLKCKTINLQANNEYFGVRFLPKTEFNCSKYSIKDIIDNEVPLNDMFLVDDSTIRKIICEKDFYEKIKLFNKMIGSIIFSCHSSTSSMKFVLSKMYSSKGNISMKQLAEEMGYSTRYLRKKFEQCIGIPPKLFSQILRFQYSLFMLTKTNEYSIWDIINEIGYYDQAHFINEFKKFSHLTPNKLLYHTAKNSAY